MDEKKQLIVEKIGEHNGIMKTCQLYDECGLDYRTLDTLVKNGFLERIKNGYYGLKETKKSEEEMIVALFPDGVLCLESALYYYGYIKDKPFSWDIAVDKNTSKSRFLIDYPVVVPFYTEPRVLQIGVSTITLAGQEMKIYDRDRMICDVLKYEHKLDREILKQAIRGYINDSNKDIHHLLEYAKERKVQTKVQNMIGVWL